MLRVGITGQSGFIGQHLYSTLQLFPKEFSIIEFRREFMEDPSALDAFTAACDVIVHLAAKNRHNDPQVIYQSNLALVNALVDSLDRTGSKVHLIFSSSTQENKGNPYGLSKKEGRVVLENWASRSNGRFTGLIIPNVFGAFGNPYYNSVIATFSYQLINNEVPKIDRDADLDLIYIGELIDVFLERIRSAGSVAEMKVQPTYRISVSGALALLTMFKKMYFDKGEIPGLKNRFELNLFNTFRSYIDIRSHFPVKLQKHVDNRGAFVEVIRQLQGGQTSFSTTLSGVTRGNHFHTRKIERFAVVSGEAIIRLRRIGTDVVFEFRLSGDEPAYVDMPIWYTHSIENIGKKELFTIFWISEWFDPEDADTFYESVALQ